MLRSPRMACRRMPAKRTLTRRPRSQAGCRPPRAHRLGAQPVEHGSRGVRRGGGCLAVREVRRHALLAQPGVGAAAFPRRSLHLQTWAGGELRACHRGAQAAERGSPKAEHPTRGVAGIVWQVLTAASGRGRGPPRFEGPRPHVSERQSVEVRAAGGREGRRPERRTHTHPTSAVAHAPRDRR